MCCGRSSVLSPSSPCTTSASCPPGRGDTNEFFPCHCRPLSKARKRNVQRRGHQQCAAASHSHKSQKLQTFINVCWGLVLFFCVFLFVCLGFGFVFHNKTCDISHVGDLDLTFQFSVLPRSVSKRCLCPSLFSLMVCDFKGSNG